jgi:peptide/nickel transport system permease protein
MKIHITKSLFTHSFAKFLYKKIFFYVIVTFIALTFIFLIPRLMQGNPIDQMIPPGTTDAGRLALKKQLEGYFGLNKTLLEQYVAFWANLLRGNLGVGIMQGYDFRPIADVVMSKLPKTLALAIPVLLIGFFIGNWIGGRAAYTKGKPSEAVYFTSILSSQMPFYWFAMVMLFILAVDVANIIKLAALGIVGCTMVVLLLLTITTDPFKRTVTGALGLMIVALFVLAVYVGIFPTGGTFSPRFIPALHPLNEIFVDLLRHYALPFLTLLIITTGGWASGMRSMTLYELDAGYILYARQLGFRETKLMSYARRNAILPQFTGLNINLNNLIGMTMIIEMVFRWDGLGLLALDAVRARDYFMILGTFLVTMVVVIVGNLLVDIAYAFLDPRIRTGREG